MKIPTAALAVSLSLAFLGLAPDAAATKDAADARTRPCERELEQATLELEQIFVRRDLDAFMAPFLDNAVQVVGTGQVLDGKPAITAFYRAVMANEFTFKRTITAQRFEQCSSAIVVDHIEFTTSAGVTSQAIDVANWVRVGGKWRLISDTTTPIAKS
ncbi:MAG: DUF4440 domain-containing protein [Dokdonella sp.]